MYFEDNLPQVTQCQEVQSNTLMIIELRELYIKEYQLLHQLIEWYITIIY